MSMAVSLGGLFLIFGGLLVLAGFVLWIWMLVECLRAEPREGNERLKWGLIIFFAGAIGALIYMVVRRPQRIEQTGT